jgi:hypothetical protein
MIKYAHPGARKLLVHCLFPRSLVYVVSPAAQISLIMAAMMEFASDKERSCTSPDPQDGPVQARWQAQVAAAQGQVQLISAWRWRDQLQGTATC